MNLTWHVVKKDIRRFRLPLALWAGLILLQTILCFVLFRWADEEVMVLRTGLNGLDALHEILWGMQLVLGFFLVAGLVQEDPLVGQQTWWVTRPITGLRLLSAKLIAAILFFGVLPVLALLPWWLFCGYGASEVLRASLQIVLGQAIVSVLAFGVATLTANYSRFTVVFLLLVFAWICCSGPIFAFRMNGLSWGPGMTRILLTILVAITTLFAVIIHQYRTRALPKSWAILGTGFVLMLLSLGFAPWDWSSAIDWRSGEPAGLAKVVATPGPVDLHERRKSPYDDESMVTMLAGIRFEGLPRGVAINGGRAAGTLRWPDGTNLERQGWTFSYIGPVAWELMGASVSAKKYLVDSQRGDLSVAPSAAADIGLPRSYAVKLRERAPAWDAHFKLNVYAGEVVAEVPLKPGARDGRAGHRIEVREVLRFKAREDKGLTLTIAETEPVLDSDNLPGFLTTANRRGTPNTFYALVSKDRSKIAMVGEERLIYTMMGTVGVEQRRIDFAPGFLAYPAQPDWLDDAVLMKVAFYRVGSISRAVHTDRLEELESSRAKPIPGVPAPAPNH